MRVRARIATHGARSATALLAPPGQRVAYPVDQSGTRGQCGQQVALRWCGRVWSGRSELLGLLHLAAELLQLLLRASRAQLRKQVVLLLTHVVADLTDQLVQRRPELRLLRRQLLQLFHGLLGLVVLVQLVVSEIITV